MSATLDELCKQLNKNAKEEIITLGLNGFNYRRIPFTSPRMNYCTFGGIPIGKITEFYGEEHGGKTTSALDIVANYQHLPDAKAVLYIDAENTLDADWARKLGVDVDSMYILQPKAQSAEQIFQIICDFVDSGEVGLWVLDSLGVLLSQQEYDKTLEDKTYGGIAKPLTLFSKKVEMLMQRHKCTGIGINQIREDLGSTWGGYTTPGGKAWKHVCSVRLQFSRGKFIDEKGNELTRSAESPAGNIVMMSMTKNKTCPAVARVGFYTLTYADGIDYIKDLIDVAIRFDFVQKAGAWYNLIDFETGEIIKKLQGMQSVKEYLSAEENIEYLKSLENQIDCAINNR